MKKKDSISHLTLCSDSRFQSCNFDRGENARKEERPAGWPRSKIYQDADDRDKKNFIRLIHSLLALLLEILRLLFPGHSTPSSSPRAILFSRACARVHIEPS